MKLLRAKVSNFGSYKELEFSFESKGLSLIFGSTGSGKSTFQDIPCWILYGITAKNGNADDVRSWVNEDTPTHGELELITKSGSKIKVTRTRGKPGQTDFYWEQEDGVIVRGKDILDTQKLLNNILGVDSYLYTLGAYYNEFSPSGSFFTAKGSDRRELFEGLADLTLPTVILENSINEKRKVKQIISEITEKYNKISGRSEQLKSTERNLEKDAKRWSEDQEKNKQILKDKSDRFEQDKQLKLDKVELDIQQFEITRQNNIKKYKEEFPTKVKNFMYARQCVQCGTLRAADDKELNNLCDHYDSLISKEEFIKNPFYDFKESTLSQENTYLQQLESEYNKPNPLLLQLDKLRTELSSLLDKEKELKYQLDELTLRFDSLSQLQKINEKLRGELLKRAISDMESEVNRYLESYFDSEIRVKFTLEDRDKLEILLWKSGHECSYRQLSKGQRSLLKLSFSVSVMKSVANNKGISFNTLMFDEALDGLDTELKIKAYNMFAELAKIHENVLVIDHAQELQSMFDSRYRVTLTGDLSYIQEE